MLFFEPSEISAQISRNLTMSELLNKVRTLIRTRHYRYRTEQTYILFANLLVLIRNTPPIK